MVLAMASMTPEELKAALKQGLKEWLDEKFSDFGKWSAMGIGAAALALLAYFVMALNGWHK